MRRARALETECAHDAQALRHKLSGCHGYCRCRGAGARRAGPQRIRTVNVEFNDADDINDCCGETFAALVDLAADGQYEQCLRIDFEPERQRQAAPKLLASLEALLPYAEGEAAQQPFESAAHALAGVVERR